MDHRLSMAIAASVEWYDAVFETLGIPTTRRGDVWVAQAEPPPFHSAVKTLAPGLATDEVLAAMAAFPQGSVADSFGDQHLAAHGFDLLIEASWLHRTGTTGAMPDGWAEVERPTWSDWLPRHPRMAYLGRFEDDQLVGGVVVHDTSGAVSVSNRWNVAWTDVVAAAGALHPGRDLVDYAQGDDLAAALAAGFSPVGPQWVWVR